MMNDSDLRLIADPKLQQYFLVAPEKLRLLIQAADVQPTDRVLEVGAGAGTVARHVPQCRSLTVVEFDERLISRLRANVPDANVIQGDALHLVHEVPFDVLIGNLPNFVTDELLSVLPELKFRTAVLAVGQETDVSRLLPEFDVTEVTTISGDDFLPAQPSVSRIVRLTPPAP